MTDKTSIGRTISRLRREKGLTRAELADRLNVSHQAVSQWECGDTLPDILTLPALAEALSIDLAGLLGVTETAVVPVSPPLPPVSMENPEDALPASEENVLDFGGAEGEYEIIVMKDGQPVDSFPDDLTNTVKITLVNPGGNISSALSVTVENSVSGDVNAGTSVWIGGDVEGDASSGTDMTCGSVHGDASCGMTLNCADIAGNAAAGMNVNADNIAGDVSSGMGVTCYSRGGSDDDDDDEEKPGFTVDGMNVTIDGDYEGDLSCAASVTVNGDVEGDVTAGGNLTIDGDVDGDAQAGGNLTVGGDVDGDANAGGNLDIEGDVEGDADAKGSICVEGDLDGDAECGGDLTVEGDVNGDVKVKGNAQVGGDVNGDIRAKEVHVDGDYNA